MEIFHIDVYLGLLAGGPAQDRREKHAMTLSHQVAEVARVLVGEVEPVAERVVLRERAGSVQSCPVKVKRTKLLLEGIVRCGQRLLGGEIDEAARFQASVQDGGGPLEHLDLFDIGGFAESGRGTSAVWCSPSSASRSRIWPI